MHFATFDWRLQGANQSCSLCSSSPASLHYEVAGDSVSSKLNGFCCSRCASNLVQALAARQLADRPSQQS
jgi:hypothetical protein